MSTTHYQYTKNISRIGAVFAIALAVFYALIVSSLAGPDCTCRYQGKNISEGQSACIKTAKGLVLARCERVLNNTSWKFTENACPVG